MANYRPTVLTKSGVKVLQNVIQGKSKLEFSKIKIGIGQVGDDISELTDLVDSKIEANITAIKNNEDGSCNVCGSYSNEGMTESYTLNEIGVFVKDSNGCDVLYAYSTADGEGEWFGHGSTLLQENIEMVVYVSTVEEITANIVRSTKAREVDVNGTDLESVLISMDNRISQLVNPNLLINSNFRTRYMVNQRLQKVYDLVDYNQSYVFDMFRLYKASIDSTGYVDLNGEFVKLVKTGGDSTIVLEQRLENFKDYAGKTVTFSAKVKTENIGDRFILYVNIDGVNTVHIVKASTSTDWEVHYININVPVGISSNMSLKISNVEVSALEICYLKLELGEKATEFIDCEFSIKREMCHRYLQEVCVQQSPLIADSGNQIFVLVNTFARMRLDIVPGVITSPLMCIHRISNNTVQKIGVKGDVINVLSNRSSIELINYNNVQLTKGELYTINNSDGAGNLASGPSYLLISAEL